MLRLLNVLCAAALLVCAAVDAGAEAPEAPKQQRAEMWIDLFTGEPVDFEEVTTDLAQADLIFVGERHTVPRHHRWQLRIVDALTSGGAPLVLGLEMMEKRFQPALDRYCIGAIDFDGLVKETEWSKHWSNYADYRPILESARQAGAAILALNADKDAIRKIWREGLEGLTPEERSALPRVLKVDDEPYFALLKLEMMVHAAVQEEDLKRIFTAQVARDETMADTLAAYLKSPAGKGRKAVVLCGAGHCAYGYGTVSRLKKRLPDASERIVILSDSGDVFLPPEMLKYVREIHITHRQLRDVIRRPLGDYLSVIQPKRDGESADHQH